MSLEKTTYSLCHFISVLKARTSIVFIKQNILSKDMKCLGYLRFWRIMTLEKNILFSSDLGLNYQNSNMYFVFCSR